MLTVGGVGVFFNLMNRLTVEGLIRNGRGRLGLIGTSGSSGFMNDICCAKVQRYTENGTFHDDLAPRTTLMLTSDDLIFLNASPSKTHEKTFDAFVSSKIPCIILSKTSFLPDFMIRFSNICHIPLVLSIFDEFLLESRLLQLLREKINRVITVHGALVNVNGMGVMITGESGTGKTTCAIQLAHAGHYWIADDVVTVMKKDGDILYGRSHERVRNFIAMKHVGIINARQFLGVASVCEESPVNIMYRFVTSNDMGKAQGRDVSPDFHDIMGVKLPCVRFPVGADEKKTAAHIDLMTRHMQSCKGSTV